MEEKGPPVPSLARTVTQVLDDKELDSFLAGSELGEADGLSTIDVVGVAANQQETAGKGSIGASEENCESSGPATYLMLPEDSVGGLQYVREAAAEIGVTSFSPQEVAPGVKYPASEKLVYRACRNLAELILRKAYRVRWDRAGGGVPAGEVTADDVRRAVAENPIFSGVLTQDGLGTP